MPDAIEPLLIEPQLRSLSADELAECFTKFDDFLEELQDLLQHATRFSDHLVADNPDVAGFDACKRSLKAARSNITDGVFAFRSAIGWHAKAERDARAAAKAFGRGEAPTITPDQEAA